MEYILPGQPLKNFLLCTRLKLLQNRWKQNESKTVPLEEESTHKVLRTGVSSAICVEVLQMPIH
jgi:hypothetical protein